MGGGILQLSSYGGQDVETIGNPQMTFFKSVYKRHTNFAIETIEQSFEGNITNNENKITSIINKNGDLIHRCFLDIKFPEFPTNGLDADQYTNWTNATGYAYLKEVSLFIGDLLIDKHISEWFDIWNELTDTNNNEHLFVNKHLAKKNTLKNNNRNRTCKPIQCYIPLQFWFNRFISSALPLLSLQYHDVKIQFLFRNLRHLINTSYTNVAAAPTQTPSVKLFVDYIFLDAPERKQFAEKSHEYLIEQVQFKKETLKTSNNINFNHPVKELIWVVRNKTVGTESTSNVNVALNSVKTETNSINTMNNGNDYFNYATLTYDANRTEYVGGFASNEPFEKAVVSFNGIDRFSKHRASYFRTIQPLTYHSKVPRKHIYNYSFCIKPESLQPSGSCNFSRMQDCSLKFDNITTDDSELFVFARNYNVLVIHAGMGGLKYSN